VSDGSTDRMTHRREFLSDMAGGAAVLASTGLLAACASAPQAVAAAPAPAPTPGPLATGVAATDAPRAPRKWDVGWTERITGAHKQVFDAPEISDGTVLHQARTWMRGYADVYGTKDGDMSAVMVLRHEAIPIVLGDEAWDRFELGKELKLKDPTTGKPARRNPFINAKSGDKYALIWTDGGLDTLISRGAIALACNLALGGFVGERAQKTKMDREVVRKIVFDGLVKGVIVQPSGIFAVTRAQEAGCNYIRAT
jgi:hypothetical protein